MSKKIMALTLAAAASGTVGTTGAAFAQSNVTIYGNVDVGFVHSSGSNGALPDLKSQNSVRSAGSQSYVGFKGTEDLGNGLKALFDLQYRINPDENSGLGTAGAGHQYVGLTGGFGTAVAGYLDGIRYGIFGKYNPFGNYSIGNFAQMTTQYDRGANAVAYISPAYNGFTLVVAAATNTQGPEGTLNAVHSPATTAGGNNGDDRLFSINLQYANGPFSGDIDYETTRAVGYSDNKLYVFTTGASYDFGSVKVGGLYDIIKGDPNSFIGGNTTFASSAFGLAHGQNYDRRNWFFGASVPLGRYSLLASYGKVQDRTLSNADASKIAVGVRYALSKRTELYADYAHIKNDDNAAFQLNPMGNSSGQSIGVNGIALGMKHSF